MYGILRYTDPSPAARRWRGLHLTVLSIGLLAVILLSIDELPRDVKHWLRVVIWAVTVVFFLEYLLRLWVAPDLNQPTVYVGYLFQGGLGMPDREYYLSTNPKMVSTRDAYRAHIARVLELAGGRLRQLASL